MARLEVQRAAADAELAQQRRMLEEAGALGRGSVEEGAGRGASVQRPWRRRGIWCRPGS